MTKIHILNLFCGFADSVADGIKSFEIRKNDRGFQKGDLVKFSVVDEKGYEVRHKLGGKYYQITYVMNGYGLKNGYVVFGFKEFEE